MVTFSDLQERVIRAVVSVFEVGKPTGGHDTVAYNPNDKGGISYGMNQASLTSGNLYVVVQGYVNAEGTYAAQLTPFLPQLRAKSPALNIDQTFRNLLVRAGADPVMQKVQEDAFDQRFLRPAFSTADNLGLTKPLSALVVCDGMNQGGFDRIRNITTARYGNPRGREQLWISTYLCERHRWLACSSNGPMRASVYRVVDLKNMVKADNWELRLPIMAHGVVLTEENI